MTGDKGIVAVAEHPEAVSVVTGIVGCAGLYPTVAAIKAGKARRSAAGRCVLACLLRVCTSQGSPCHRNLLRAAGSLVANALPAAACSCLRQRKRTNRANALSNANATTKRRMTIAAVAAVSTAAQDICLANKETLIAGGPYVLPLARKHNIKILPVRGGTRWCCACAC